MTNVEKQRIVDSWHKALLANSEAFLDFAECLNINEFVVENGERVVWLEDGNYYIAHALRIGENDGAKEKEIIETLAGCGVEFKKEQ